MVLILHSGDWHIGTAGVDEDIRAAVQAIATKARMEINPQLIILPGDIYDGASTPEDRNMAKDLICELAEAAPVVIIKGNHDAAKDLLILGNLAARNVIRVYEHPGTIIMGDCAIHTLPHFSKSGWIAAGISQDNGIEAGNKTVSELALNYLRAMIVKAGDQYKHLLYGHLTIKGSMLENHQPLLGESITFGYHDLIEAGFSGGGFSHIHLSQAFGDRSKGEPEFRYAGSPVALNYGESCKNKSFCVLDTETLAFTLYPLQSILRVGMEAMFDGQLHWTSDGHDPVPGARIKVKLLIEDGYSADDAEEAVRRSIAEQWPDPLELKIERQRKPRDLVRAQEIAAAQDACQKLIAYWTATNTTPEEPLRSDMLAITKEAEAECAINK
jgi:DNA repair exonuclease SbcCD nuclease subunit